MLTAITRKVSPAIANCELTFLARQKIDVAKACEQHHSYEQALTQLGARVISLPAEPELPDSMFVEDPALVLDELAIIFPLGTESRRPEARALEKTLADFRKVTHISLPSTVEGGDVLRIGKKLFVGLSSRTNAQGIAQLRGILAPGYEVVAVKVTGCLHLKSAATYLGENTLLANRAWFDVSPFSGLQFIDVDPEEPQAANALAISETVLFPCSFPRTHTRLQERGFRVVPLDISELQKAESGLTCSSLLFEVS